MLSLPLSHSLNPNDSLSLHPFSPFPSCDRRPKTAMKVVEDDREIIFSNTHLLQSLVDSIPQTQSFRGKWSIIRTKLETLHTHLSDLSDYPTTNTLSLDLLRSLSQTLSAALTLCRSCQGSTLPDGKLKTQNDVDSITGKLDGHIRDFDVILSSGVLEENVASVSTVSKRETVRAEARSLVTRLQIGTAESKNSAVDSLLGLLMEDDKNVLIAVAQGVVPVLVRLLDSSSSPEIKEKTVMAIARVSTVDSSKHVLIAEGLALLHNLLRVLESGSVFAKEKACVALHALSHSKENVRAIGSRGGISSLLEICQAGTPSSQAAAAGVLRNLAAFSDTKENFIEESAVSILLALAGSGTALAQENAIGCLSNLLSDDQDLKLFVAREGGIESLKNFWDSAPTARSLEVAVEMLRNLSSCPLIAEILVSDGILNRIAGILSCGILTVRIAAANCVFNLGFNSKTRKELGELGCIPLLVRMLDGKAADEKEAAAKALSVLMNYAGNRRIFRKEEKGIVGVVQLLDPSIQNVDKKYPVSILASLTHSKNCRKQMAVAGACGYLQKLSGMDVEGSKKLLEAIGRGKLWGVFSRG